MAIAMQYGNGRNGLLNVGMSMTLLWTNVDDESAFAAQTLSLNIGGYDAVLIKFKLAANVSTYANTIGFVGERTTLYSSNASTTSYTYKRYATITTSDITFSTGYRGTTAGTSYAIPCEVYGIKRGGSSGGSSSSGSGGGGGGTGTLTQVTFDGTVYTDDGTGNVTLDETDPVFVASDAYSITSTDISNWNGKADSSSLATVATSGSYTDLSNTPILATVATSGSYSDLSNTPSLAAVATSGDYSDLSNTPVLATVATSGDYDDLSNKPTIPADLWEQGVDANDQPVAGAIKAKDFTSGGITYTNTASGISSLAFGANNSVTTSYGVGVGYGNTVTGQASMAFGGSNTAGTGNYAFAFGYGNQATGANSHAEGSLTNATNNSSHSEGSSTSASGQASHAEGASTTSSATASHSEGNNTQATANYSHAEGNGTQATANQTHAEGYQSHATATGAHAEGRQTTASGNYSHSGGNGTVANSMSQTVFGEYNAVDPGFTAANARGTYIEIVGNGADAQNLSNARTLDWSGNEWVAGDITAGGNVTDGSGNVLSAKVENLTDLGITATATELNYTDGVTSNIQDQLDAKAKKSTTESNLAYVESTSTASRAYSVGDCFVNSDGVLCKITATVPSGGTLTSGTNYDLLGGYGGLASLFNVEVDNDPCNALSSPFTSVFSLALIRCGKIRILTGGISASSSTASGASITTLKNAKDYPITDVLATSGNGGSGSLGLHITPSGSILTYGSASSSRTYQAFSIVYCV